MDDVDLVAVFKQFDVRASHKCHVVTWHVVPGQIVTEGDVLCDVEIGGRIRQFTNADDCDFIVGPVMAPAGAPLSPGDLLVPLWGIALEPEATEEELAFDEQHGPTAGLA